MSFINGSVSVTGGANDPSIINCMKKDINILNCIANLLANEIYRKPYII